MDGMAGVMGSPVSRQSSMGGEKQEFTSLQREIEELREYIAAQDRMKSKPNKIFVFLTNVYDRLFHFYILMKGHFNVCAAYMPPARVTLGAVALIVFVLLILNIDNIPTYIQQAQKFLRKHVPRSLPETDAYTVAHNGYFYRTLRPSVEVDSFRNPYLDNGRTVLTCPVRFPVPEGWTLVPEEEMPDVVTNVVAKHYWSSSVLVLNLYAAYPTLSLRSQVARPYPQATAVATTLPPLVDSDPFVRQGPWFDLQNIEGQEWVQQNLLPVNTRECLMIVFSFASRGYRDDHVEDVVPACELCSTNILVRRKIDNDD